MTATSISPPFTEATVKLTPEIAIEPFGATASISSPGKTHGQRRAFARHLEGGHFGDRFDVALHEVAADFFAKPQRLFEVDRAASLEPFERRLRERLAGSEGREAFLDKLFNGEAGALDADAVPYRRLGSNARAAYLNAQPFGPFPDRAGDSNFLDHPCKHRPSYSQVSR